LQLLGENGIGPAEGYPDEPAHKQRILGISMRREPARFLLCDASMNVLFASPDVDPALLSVDTLKPLQLACRELRVTGKTMYQAFDNDTVLRIVPLGAKLFGCVAIFIDAFSRRGSVFEAAKLYGLTKRESEVLQLLIRGNTNPEIANELCVAESTAGDHIKSLMRKTKSTKRVQLLGKVFNLQHDILPDELLEES
jgi:DNA-binding CsgD family transcriptional regulator